MVHYCKEREMKDIMKNKNNGFTLVEVVLSFVLISIISLLVGHTFTSAYVMSSKLEEMPKNYYKAQAEIEEEISILSDDINEFYNLDNEIKNKPDSEITPEMVARHNELEKKLAMYTKKPIELFGKDIDMYTFNNNQAKTKIVAGGVNFVSHNHTVPIINNVSINNGELDTYGLFEKCYDPYGHIDRKIYANVVFDNKNKSTIGGIHYDWYVGDKKYHTVPFIEGYKYSSNMFLNAFALFPSGFKLVEDSGSQNFLKIDESFYNRFVVCVATPISKDGSAGMPKVSNYVYVSGLPTTKLKANTLETKEDIVKMVIDPSLDSQHYTTEEEVELKEINSRYNFSGKTVKLYAEGSNYPKLNLVGSMTNTDFPSDVNKQFYTRYIKFDENSSMKTKNFDCKNNSYIYIVARDRNKNKEDFVFTGSASYGFQQNSGDIAMTGPSEEGWQIIRIALNGDSDCDGIVFGKSNVDIAEISVLSSINGDHVNERMVNYLSSKYSIDAEDIGQEFN